MATKGGRVCEGQPIFLYVQVFIPIKGLQRLESTSFRDKESSKQTHDILSNGQTTSRVQKSDLPSKRSRSSPKNYGARDSPPHKLPKSLSSKQLTKSPLHQGILGAQPFQPPDMTLDPPAIRPSTVSAGISQLIKQPFEDTFSHSRSPNHRISGKFTRSSVTPPNSPLPEAASDPDVNTTQSSETPDSQIQESTEESTVASPPPSIVHQSPPHQIQSPIPQSPQNFSLYAQAIVDEQPVLPWCQLVSENSPIDKNTILNFPPTYYYILAPVDGRIEEIHPRLNMHYLVQVFKKCAYIL